MSHWGDIKDKSGNTHIIPCDKEGCVEGEHEVSVECWCKPNRISDVFTYYVHNDRERGGYNS